MNELDYAVIGIVVLSLIIGIVRGGIREIFNLIGWVIAFVAAQGFASELAHYLAEWMADASVRIIVAWLIVFLATAMLVSAVGSLIAEGVRKLGLGFLDRGLGAVVGALRGGLIVMLLTLAAGMTTFPDSRPWRQALLTPWLETGALLARPLLPDALARRISYGRARTHQTSM